MTDEIHQRATTSPHLDVLEGMSRRTLLKASGAGASGLALGATASPGAAQEGDDEPVDDIAELRIPHLDLETLEAELDGETLQAAAYEEWRQGSTSYVGEVAGRPGLFVGVSLLEEVEADEETEGDQELIVYLCDGEIGTTPEIGVQLAGEHDPGGVTLSQEEYEVTVALVDGEFLGVATVPDDEPVAFVASEATGDADLYRAESDERTVDDVPLTIRWVVLPDDRQRGSDMCCTQDIFCIPCRTL